MATAPHIRVEAREGALPEWAPSNRDLACHFGPHGGGCSVRSYRRYQIYTKREIRVVRCAIIMKSNKTNLQFAWISFGLFAVGNNNKL
jgi:hypothetical protein